MKILSSFVSGLLKAALSAVKANPEVRKLLGELHEAGSKSLRYIEAGKVRELYKIHPTARWGIRTRIYGSGQIFIGENTYLGENSMVLANKPDVKVVIGKDCAISHNVQIRTEINKKARHFKEDRYELPPAGADVVIGDYVWVGANVFIGGGVSIGENSIIGANSVVTRDVPAHAVYGGVPARLIRWKKDY